MLVAPQKEKQKSPPSPQHPQGTVPWECVSSLEEGAEVQKINTKS